jgi:predicted dehydrogenase
MSEPVRIGFVGVGSMGQCAHLRNYATLGECRVVALAEPRPKLAAAVAARWGVPKVYPEAEAMLAAEQLDALVAPQPFDRHGQILPGLYGHGLPVLSEKPLAASIPVGERLVAQLRAAGGWHMVAYHKRSDPATMHAKAEIERLKASGEFGALKYVRITMPPGDWIAAGFNDLIQTDDPWPAMARDPAPDDLSAAHYGEYIGFVNYYIHQVNLLRHLLGEPYTVSYADPSQVLLVAHGLSGVTGVIEMAPYATTIDWQESALAAFERGWIRVDLPAPVALNRPGRVTIYRDNGDGPPTRSEPQMPWIHAMRSQAANFVAAVRGERPPLCEAAEALEDLRVARAWLKLLRGV